MGKTQKCLFESLKSSFMEGFLLIDKEKGITSFDVVCGVRRKTGVKKVGHGGTLDPLATGLLVVAVGRSFTKKLHTLLKTDKEYEVVGKFGYVSDSYDADGEIKEVNKDFECEKQDIQKMILRKFLGEIEQMPPKYSALKVKGRRACDIVRAGGEVELKSRKIRIDSFEIMDFQWPEVRFRVKCGSGTYIRSLIHDLGQELGCGAYVKELRRTKVGEYSVENAVKVEEI
jgi:tRNA pseudouridine55 synthase